jgi:hypothetical protein
MEDQIRYEQKRYENLRMAIMKEEYEEQGMFKPRLSEKSMQIM